MGFSKVISRYTLNKDSFNLDTSHFYQTEDSVHAVYQIQSKMKIRGSFILLGTIITFRFHQLPKQQRRMQSHWLLINLNKILIIGTFKYQEALLSGKTKQNQTTK